MSRAYCRNCQCCRGNVSSQAKLCPHCGHDVRPRCEKCHKTEGMRPGPEGCVLGTYLWRCDSCKGAAGSGAEARYG